VLGQIQTHADVSESPEDGDGKTSLHGSNLKGADSHSPSKRVLVLDGDTRSALAATRSLGRKGLHVVVAGKEKRTLAGCSKYCRESFSYPPPGEQPDAFVATLKAQCSQRGVSVIFPMTEITTATVLKHRKHFEDLRIPFVEFDVFDAVSDKWRLFQLAQQLGLSIPRTYFISDAKELEDTLPKLNRSAGFQPANCPCRRDAGATLSFPVVLKPYRSSIDSNGRWISASVRYANSARELKVIMGKHEYLQRHPFLIQEYVSGHAEGIFALYDHGKPVVFFAHRRLRERPPSGGVSVLCESIEANPEALNMARLLLDHLGWHGVAMVEFKVSPEGTPYLMEVNGRFWGSLQLAIDAGVDFPWLLYQLATGRTPDKPSDYATGIKCRWLLGDFVRLCKVMLGNGLPPLQQLTSRMQSLLQFLRLFDKTTRYEVNRWDDLGPCWLELRRPFRDLGARLLSGLHGKAPGLSTKTAKPPQASQLLALNRPITVTTAITETNGSLLAARRCAPPNLQS
jgi:predicted ATP-grasp superfamily ATP-dependent carboligase